MIFGNKKCTLKLHGLTFGGEEGLLVVFQGFADADPVYLFTVYLFYLYFCANAIAKLITKAKAMAVIEN